MSERTTRRSWSLREQCRNRPHQLGKDNDFVILHPDALKTLSEGGNTDASHGIVEGIERVRVIQIVIDFSPGRRSGSAVLELQHAEARFNPVWRADRRGNSGSWLGEGQGGKCRRGAGCQR